MTCSTLKKIKYFNNTDKNKLQIKPPIPLLFLPYTSSSRAKPHPHLMINDSVKHDAHKIDDKK